MALRSLDSALRCTDARCGTLLALDAEVCDECGGTDLVPATSGAGVLLGLAGERPVAFGVSNAETIIGRGSGNERPDIDLSRFPSPSSGSVHRRHASIQQLEGRWRISHLGRNPLVIQRENETLVIEPGGAVTLLPGDWLQIGRVRLRFVSPPGGSTDVER